jgi:hypothetical protein
MTQDLSSPTQEILDAYDNTSEHSIAERKALAAALRMLMKQHQEYADDGCGPFIVHCYDIWSVIDELERPGEEEITEEEEEEEEENERRFKECMELIKNITREEIVELMGENFLEEFRRVSRR